MGMHAGRAPCLLASQCSMRSDHGGYPGPIAAQSGPVGSPASPQGTYASPAQARSAGGAASPHRAATARPAVGSPYRGIQGGCQPMTARGPTAPCSTGHYHSSGASTCRGVYQYPLAIGSSRCAVCTVHHEGIACCAAMLCHNVSGECPTEAAIA